MTETSNNYVKTIRELLRLPEDEEDDFGLPVPSSGDEPVSGSAEVFSEVPAGLPIASSDEMTQTKDITESEDKPVETLEQITSATAEQGIDVGAVDLPDVSDEIDTAGLKSRLRVLLSKSFVRYPAIFAVAFLFFYVILNFQAVSSQIANTLMRPAENQSVVLADDLGEYNAWIGKYYFYSSDQEILAANNDADRDGLSNVEEFHLNTNPFLADTDDDGFDDGQELLNGYNPLYSGFLTHAQSEAVSGNVDLATVQSRKDFAFSDVAGASTDGFIVDTNREGRISIAKLGVNVPLVWNKNFEWIQDDLKHGAVHHPNTVYPGQNGMSSIHAHSSGYVWDGEFKNAFTEINFLEPGDEVFVTVFGFNNQTRSYRYIVRSKKVFEVEDQGQFADQGGYHLNLSTSWPIGTARQRYVVTCELAGL